MLVLMMDEGSVMERAYFTVVPPTAVLRSISTEKEQMCLVLHETPEWIWDVLLRLWTEGTLQKKESKRKEGKFHAV